MGWRAARVAFADVARLQEALGCAEPLAWILVRRGLGEPADARAFLDAADPATPLEDPEALPGIGEAADRLADAVRRGERIAVHGDYDCDGITSTALLVQALRARGAKVRPFLPSRFTDGYGVSLATVEMLAQEGCDVLVCVDCGTTAVEPLTRATELGIAPIVCDHHLAAGARPPGILANPALGVPRDDLPAAAGVVFKLTRALAARLDGGGLAPDPLDGIDLVALATVADAVPLVGENRRLVARGLAAMRTAPRVGIAALCRAAGVAPRALDARHLGFTLAPSLNAAGRMAHPERGLELMLATDPAVADPLAAELWGLNLQRRDVERAIVDEAVQIIEASPPDTADAPALVVAGDGWHEGVVGIVASRLVDRFGRPAIVLTRDAGGRAKGSGRSLPGVDLHALVAAAAERLTRWGGHQGAVGLELRSEHVAEFAGAFARAAEGSRAAIERARVRVVDAVAAVPDMSLALAEAVERLAPFGRGNPEVRFVIPGAAVARTQRVGQEGRHLEVRLQGHGAHARAIGFRLGGRHDTIDGDARHDAVVRLGVERYQELVGPQLTLEALEPLSGRPVTALCRRPCDVTCPDRGVLGPDLLDAPVTPPDAPAGTPVAVRDRRATESAVPAIAALAGADGGVVAVVADVARRRVALEGVLEASRLGCEAAPLGGTRCDMAGVITRLAMARGGPILAMVEYAVLPHLELPDNAHVALVDPPASAAAAAWAVARADGRWLHLLWGEREVELAVAVAEERLATRPAAAAVWRALADGATHAWGPALDRLLLGDGPTMRPPAAVARAMAALRDIGLLAVDASGVRAVPDAPRRELTESPVARAAEAHLEECRAFLSRAMTVDLTAGPVPGGAAAGGGGGPGRAAVVPAVSSTG